MLVLVAVLAEFAISGNTLSVLGISYSTPGGNPLVKFHPATYLAAFAAIVAISSGANRGYGVNYLISKASPLVLFLLLTVVCAIYALVNVGITGVGVYIDTYLSAGLLTVAMVNANARQKACLARLLLVLLIFNVLLSVIEAFKQDHFIPFEISGKEVMDNQRGEFRPAALYTHPLTGAMATAFGVFLLIELDLRLTIKAAFSVILSVGLLSFGGRGALVVTAGLVIARIAIGFLRDLFRGQVQGRLVAGTALGVLLLIPLLGFLVTSTPIGERIVSQAYFDDSAEVRITQWEVFNKLTLEQYMYGMSLSQQSMAFSQIGLESAENPFILIFLNLGIVGTSIFIGGVVSFFLYYNRAVPASRWLLIAALLILSTSNSIGVKSPDLFMMSACIIAMPIRSSRANATILRAVRLIRFRLPRFMPEMPGNKEQFFRSERDRGLARNVVSRRTTQTGQTPS